MTKYADLVNEASADIKKASEAPRITELKTLLVDDISKQQTKLLDCVQSPDASTFFTVGRNAKNLAEQINSKDIDCMMEWLPADQKGQIIEKFKAFRVDAEEAQKTNYSMTALQAPFRPLREWMGETRASLCTRCAYLVSGKVAEPVISLLNRMADPSAGSKAESAAAGSDEATVPATADTRKREKSAGGQTGPPESSRMCICRSC